MRKTKQWATAIAAAAFMVVGLAGWVNSSNPALEAKASTPIATTRFDAFEMMCTAKNLPDQEFEDFSLVFFRRELMESHHSYPEGDECLDACEQACRTKRSDTRRAYGDLT